MGNIIISIVGAILAVLLPSFLIYGLLMFINNVVWGYKGIIAEKQSAIYKKRRRNLFGISILISIGGIISWGAIRGLT